MSAPVAGFLLTGGASRRMGMDKTRIRVEGRALADLVGRTLATVANPVIEVGPGVTGFASTREVPPGEGPLAAISAGWKYLQALGTPRCALVVAADLPLISARLLQLLAEWPGEGSVVPVVDGVAQPLCARWSIAELTSARSWLLQTQSVRHLASAYDVTLVDESTWRRVADPMVFADVDYPQDFDRLGLSWTAPSHDDTAEAT